MTDENKPILPSEKAEQQAKDKKAFEELQQKEIDLLREDFTLTFQTAHGQRVLAWLRRRCGHNMPPLAADADGNYDKEKTLHNALELSLYLAIRKYIPRDVLYNVEYDLVEPSGKISKEEFMRITSKSQSQQKG